MPFSLATEEQHMESRSQWPEKYDLQIENSHKWAQSFTSLNICLLLDKIKHYFLLHVLTYNSISDYSI